MSNSLYVEPLGTAPHGTESLSRRVVRFIATNHFARHPRRIALVGLDGLFSAAAAYLALAARVDHVVLPAEYLRLYIGVLPLIIVCGVAPLLALRVYRIAVRHIGYHDILSIALATIVGAAVLVSALHLTGHDAYPHGPLFIGLFMRFLLVAGSRVGYRCAVEDINRRRAGRGATAERRVVIIGAGLCGAAIASEIRRQPDAGMRVIGYLDDAITKQGQIIDSVPVFGRVQDVRRVVRERDVHILIVAAPSASGDLVRRVTEHCTGLKVRCKIAPGLDSLRSANPLHTLRDVALEDLLRRQPVPVDTESVAAYVTGEHVLITGGGGSIGSELVRQIVSMKPARVLLLGHGENSIFEIEQELSREYGVEATALICDVRDGARLRRLFDLHRPTVVFHAAAHKHVPLMEANPEEAVTNNVLGTRNLAAASTEFGVKRFVMISTDKAVNPTSVMGASKRAAELAIQVECRRSETQFAIVRFGNVLGSRGSVVITMRKQIATGGPVTVTHPEVVRYFMTIPEAVQLVLQAGAMGGHGAVYMLDMGEPVRIMDLANDLIRLSGLTPGVDVPIKITGLRPGEKLYEELLTAEEGSSVTRHQRIYVAAPTEVSISETADQLDRLIAAAQDGHTAETLACLRGMVPTYSVHHDYAALAA